MRAGGRLVLIIHGMRMARDGEESKKKSGVTIPLSSSIKMSDPFCFDEQLGMELPVTTLPAKRITTVTLKSITVSIYCSQADPESRLTGRDELLSVGLSTDLYIEAPMRNIFQQTEFL